MGCSVQSGKIGMNAMARVTKVAWDVLYRVAKLAWNAMARVTKVAWDVLYRVAKLT